MARKPITVNVTVNNSQSLNDAIERLAADDGGTIFLEASSRPYEIHLTDRYTRQVDAPVRLVSADLKDPAVISKMRIVDRENLTVDDVVFDSSGTSRTSNHRDLDIVQSRGITITDSVFQGEADGPLDGTSGRVRGPTMAIVRASDDVTISGNTVKGYLHGVAVMDSNDVVLAKNEITRLQGDAIRVGGGQDVLIEGNHLHDMLGSSWNINHSDMIQIWGNGISQNNERITIRNNIINTGEGPTYQMIFGGNEDKAKNGWLFEDIVIEGNLLFGSHHHMIGLGTTRDMVVRNNTVLWNEDSHLLLKGGAEGSSVNGWIHSPGSVGTVITGNVATNISGATGPNAIVTYKDPSNASYYGRNFVNLDADGSAELQDLSLLPGSQWDRKFGAPMTWSSHKVDGVTAVVTTERAEGKRSAVTFDASLSRDEGGRLGGDAQYLWTFEGGVKKTGQTVTHSFGSFGEHDYTLEVRSGGRSDRIERTLEIEDPVLLRLAVKGGTVRDASSYDSDITVKGGRIDGDGFVLDGNSKILVSRYSDQIYSLDHFALAIEFEPASADESGVLFMLPEAMQGSIGANGSFRFSITTTEGQATATTEAGVFSGTQERDLAVIYDGREVAVYVDGVEEASAKVGGLTKALEHWGLVIGNQWNGSVKGTVSDIALARELGALGTSMPALVKGDSDSASGSKPKPVPAEEPAEEPDSGQGSGQGSGGTLVALDFEGDLSDAGGRDVGVRSKGEIDYVRGTQGRGVEIGEGSVLIARENGFLHERDSFDFAFDLKRGGAGEEGRLLQLHKVMEGYVTAEGVLAFTLRTDEGTFKLETEAGALSAKGWHEVEIGYDDEARELRLSVDDETVETRASGTTADAAYWGLSLGAAWGDTLGGVIDGFRMSDTPDWA